MDFVIKGSDHCIETEECGGGSESLAGFWLGCYFEELCKTVELGHEVGTIREDILIVRLASVG